MTAVKKGALRKMGYDKQLLFILPRFIYVVIFYYLPFKTLIVMGKHIRHNNH